MAAPLNLEAERRASLDETLLDKLRSPDGKPYGHIVERIRLLWGTRTCDEYLNSLLINDRGARAGFAPEVSKVLMSLLVANETFMRRTTGIRQVDQVTGHDWASKTGGWTIVKSPDTKRKPDPQG